MLHGPAKRREIARSVLPSTRRKSARDDLNVVRRRNRRVIKQDRHVIARAGNAGATIENFDETRANLVAYPNADIRYVVARRRDGDKLGSLLRWGTPEPS